MLRAVAAENPVENLRVYQLIPTFQLVTRGLRRRRPAGFDFSSYAEPALLGQVVNRLVSPSDNSIASGSYLVRRDGTMDPYSEITHI
jgi:cyclitol oxidoreductase